MIIDFLDKYALSIAIGAVTSHYLRKYKVLENIFSWIKRKWT